MASTTACNCPRWFLCHCVLGEGEFHLFTLVDGLLGCGKHQTKLSICFTRSCRTRCLGRTRVSNAQIVLQTLLNHFSDSSGPGPVYHLLRIYDLIDGVLLVDDVGRKIGSSSHWVSSVFPKLLYKLEFFWRLLEPELKRSSRQKICSDGQ